MIKYVVALSLILPTLGYAKTFKLDTTHSEVLFKVKHLVISTVTGRFNKFNGTFDFDEKTKKLKNVNVEIDVASIDTNEKDRDKHLRNEDFFDVKKFPKSTFKSTKVEYKKGKPFKVHGDLTIRGKKKPVVMDVDYKGSVQDAWGNQKVVFSAEFKIDRKDFGIVWNKKLDKGGLAVGNEVRILIAGQGQ
jgi:polyisoprenoid-binding protein YceI